LDAVYDDAVVNSLRCLEGGTITDQWKEWTGMGTGLVRDALSCFI